MGGIDAAKRDAMNERVEILRIAAGGAGVGRMPDGKVVFVPRTAPGDTVDISIVESRKRFARGLPLEIVSPGDARREAPCPHYSADDCGACQFQHLRYEDQLLAKGAIVGDALRRVGGLEVADPVVTPSREWGYRSKITLSVGGEVEKRIGFRAYSDPDRVFEMADCPVATDPVRAAWSALADTRGLLPDDLTQIVLRESGDTIHLVLTSEVAKFDPTPLVERVAGPCSVWLKRADGTLKPVAGADDSPPLVFEQSNLEMAQAIRQEAVAGLGDCDGKVVADLYCGMGMTTQLLVEAGALARAVDSDTDAIEWAAGETPRAMFVAGRVEECLSQLGDPEAIVVNPPRTGLSSRVRDWLKDRREQGAKIAYISCDPATLARDLKHIGCPGLQLLRAYDLFPQTSHVETLVVVES